MKNHTTAAHRIGLVLPEQRADLGVSQAELARISGVARATIRRLEAGHTIRPDLVLRLANALTVVELYCGSNGGDDPRNGGEDPAVALERHVETADEREVGLYLAAMDELVAS